jgi:hypothetical protein
MAALSALKVTNLPEAEPGSQDKKFPNWPIGQLLRPQPNRQSSREVGQLCRQSSRDGGQL